MITVAHRLQTIIKSDRVMVMSFGKVAEFDEPQALMKNPKSHFAKLVAEIQRDEEAEDLEKKRAEALKGEDEKSQSSSN